MRSPSPMRPLGLRTGDLLVIALVFAAAFLTLFFRGQADPPSALTVRTEAGTARYSLPRREEIALRGEGYSLRLTVDGFAVSVRESDCPGRDCMRTGTITEAGDTIVCLPARIVITLVGGGGTDADFILP